MAFPSKPAGVHKKQGKGRRKERKSWLDNTDAKTLSKREIAHCIKPARGMIIL
jgi:hypothetical protein